MAHTKNQDSCDTVLLARDVSGEVRYCNHCGVFHVSFDAITLRFRASALTSLSSTVSTALQNYRRYIAQQGVTPSRVRLCDDIH